MTLGHPEFLRILDQIRELHVRKSADYGTEADCFANVRASVDFGVPAWLGVMIRANDKVIRLQTYAKKGELANESVEDAFLDLANYAMIGLVMWREANDIRPNDAQDDSDAGDLVRPRLYSGPDR